MDWINNISPYFTFAITILASLFAFIRSNKTQKSLGFIVAFIGALLTLSNSVYSDKQSKISKHTTDSISKINDSLQKRIDSNTRVIVSKQDLQYSAFKKNAEKTLFDIRTVTDSLKNLAKSQKEAYLTMSGGSSRPFFSIFVGPFDKKVNSIFIRVNNKGRYPIRNLIVNFPFTFNKSALYNSGDHSKEPEIIKLTTRFSENLTVGDLYQNAPVGIYQDFPPVGLDTIIYQFNYHWLRGFLGGGFMLKRRPHTNYYDVIEPYAVYGGGGIQMDYKPYFEISNALLPKIDNNN